MANSRICSIEGCSKTIFARIWCAAHYSRWLRTGDPLGSKAKILPTICTIEGCNEPVKAKGWCSRHYDRWWAHGDPLGGKPSPQPGLICKVEGCDKQNKANGLCGQHYRLSRRVIKKRFGQTKHPLYNLWCQIKNLCHNEQEPGYTGYGGRGIHVCDEWRKDFWAFAVYMPPRPSKKHSIERIDNEKGYEPGNVKWATDAEQRRNTRRNNFVTIGDRTQVVVDWAAEIGIHPNTIYNRLRMGWSAHDAVMVPAGQWREPGQNPRGRLNESDQRTAARAKIKHREAYKANAIVGNAIRAGRLVRKPCAICGEELVEAHHEDYSKPLEVEWLCYKHHGERHRKNRKNIRL